MKLQTLLLAVALAGAASAASGEDSFESTLHRTSSAHPPAYSFADLYRLTVSGGAATLSFAPANDAPIRTAIAQPAPQFAISDVREPHLGLLLASGVALALWEARRRLGYAF